MKNEIIIFEDQNVKLEVNMKDETVWLKSKQMAKLFDRDFKTIRKHINNALEETIIQQSQKLRQFKLKEIGKLKEISNITALT